MQRALAAGVSSLSRRRLTRRQASVPRRGEDAAVHVTAVLRLPLGVAERLDLGALPTGRHYRYPLDTLHVTVANLDRARTPTADAVHLLRGQALPPVVLRFAGLGCSKDTLFIRCYYGEELAALRRAVRRAFGLPVLVGPVEMVFRQIAFANVLRFDGPGEVPLTWTGPRGLTVLDELDVVRTDRFLSREATTLLSRIPLGAGPPSPCSPRTSGDRAV